MFLEPSDHFGERAKKEAKKIRMQEERAKKQAVNKEELESYAEFSNVDSTPSSSRPQPSTSGSSHPSGGQKGGSLRHQQRIEAWEEAKKKELDSLASGSQAMPPPSTPNPRRRPSSGSLRRKHLEEARKKAQEKVQEQRSATTPTSTRSPSLSSEDLSSILSSTGSSLHDEDRECAYCRNRIARGGITLDCGVHYMHKKCHQKHT